MTKVSLNTTSVILFVTFFAKILIVCCPSLLGAVVLKANLLPFNVILASVIDNTADGLFTLQPNPYF